MKSKQLKLARNEERKRNRAMSAKWRRITALICAVIVGISAVLITVHFFSVKKKCAQKI